MADANRIRDPIEIAAGSPDVRIRRAALDRMHHAKEVEKLDAFFDHYFTLPVDDTPAPVKAEQRVRFAAQPSRAPKAKSDRMTDIIVAILIEKGPLSSGDIATEFNGRAPDLPPKSKEDMRMALGRRSDIVGRVSAVDRRYQLIAMNGAKAVNAQHPVA
jgi:hypothetical protein